MGRDPITKPLFKAVDWVGDTLGGLMPKAPDTPAIQKAEEAPPPKEDDAAIKDAAAKDRELEKKRKGRASTILTGGEGDTSTAPTTRKILLGE
jgi:hypothetical protein